MELIPEEQEAYFTERLTAWKVCLPVLPVLPILAIGLHGSSLLSLSRTWRNIHVRQSKDLEIRWARDQIKRLNLSCDIRFIDEKDCCSSSYQAIAVCDKTQRFSDLSKMIGWLKPGGTVVWVGHRFQVPKNLNLMRVGFELIRRYAVLPPSVWKLIIPINNGEFAQSGLRLYEGNRWQKRIVNRLCCFASELGCQGLLGIRRQVVFAKKPGFLQKNAYILEWIGDLLGCHVGDVTIYPGTNQTPGRRKITLQVLDDTAKAIAIAKIADTKTAYAANEREASVLSFLQEFAFVRDSIPKILATGTWGGYSVQLQEAVDHDSREYCSELTDGHLNFLNALSHVGRREMKLTEWTMWNQIVQWFIQKHFTSTEEANIVRSAIKFCRDQLCDTKLLFHLTHGDFTPWNVFLKDKRLIAVDWEESDLTGLFFFDLVHFTLRKRTLLENRPMTLKELFSSTPQSLGIDKSLSTLTDAHPFFKDLSSEQKESFIQAHFILCFAMRTMLDN